MGQGERSSSSASAGRKNALVVNGREVAQQELDPCWAAPTENLFSSVFAFSLSEMQSFEWLEAEQVRDRIFSAGIAGAGASARRVIDALGSEASAILRPRGASRLRDLTARIDQAERNLEAAQAEAERYVELEQELETRAAQVEALSTEETGMLRRQHAIESALEVWSECDRARQELADLDDVREFPSEPEARLASLASGAAAARAVVRRIEEERAAKEQLRAQLAVDDHLADIAGGVEKLNAEIGPHLDRLQALAALRSRKSRNALWMALGVALVCAEVELTGRNGIAAGIAALLVSLVAVGFLLFERSARRAQIARLEHEIAAWEEPVRKWLASSSSGETLRLEFLDLRTRCERNRDMLIKAAGLDEALTESGARLESARRELDEAEAALNAFLREAGAADEAQFESRLRAFRRRQELSALIRDRESRIGEPAGNPMEWPGELRRLEEKLRETRQERDAAVGAQRLADAERRRIAGSDSTPAILAEIECLRSELAAAVREWRIVTLSKELVARTLQEFTRTRQPAVLEEASAAFARITEGTYERILQDEDGESIVIAGRRGERKRPEELSRGTAEQLYLCIRLGLASEFTRRSVSLPIIMDDVLVNFDPERARAVARELARFSVGRQILIFTCHPETARLFIEAAPEAQVVRLPRHGEPREDESVAED